jgi:TIR domain
MADIFISYSQQDREEARLLAAFLEAEGYSVWWDTSLLSGENFRKTIMTELGRARAAIVVWTENSVHSDWVQSEAGRAHADRKLIPVKAKGLSYKDIPPPFDNMHIENADDREKILAAITAQLAKPEAQPSAFGKFTKRARFELLSWFGIIGATVSLVANLQALFIFGRWLRNLLDSWTLVFKFMWQQVLFFLPRVYGSDAILLTFIAFAAINMLVCLRKTHVQRARVATFFALTTAACLIIVVFTFGMARLQEGETKLDQGYYFTFLESYVGSVLDFIVSIDAALVKLIGTTAFALWFFVFVPLLPVVFFYLVLRKFAQVRLSARALSVRLWRILAGIGLLLALNYLTLWLEQQPWALGLSR